MAYREVFHKEFENDLAYIQEIGDKMVEDYLSKVSLISANPNIGEHYGLGMIGFMKYKWTIKGGKQRIIYRIEDCCPDYNFCYQVLEPLPDHELCQGTINYFYARPREQCKNLYRMEENYWASLGKRCENPEKPD